MPGCRESSPACRLPDFRRRSGCVPAEPYPPLKQPTSLQNKLRLAIGPKHYSTFVRTALSTFVRTTTFFSFLERPWSLIVSARQLFGFQVSRRRFQTLALAADL